MKNKYKKERTTLESQHARNLAQFIKGDKNRHFAKAIAKRNAHK